NEHVYISFTFRFIAAYYLSEAMTGSRTSNLVCISAQFRKESLLTAKMNVGQPLKQHVPCGIPLSLSVNIFHVERVMLHYR
ncbi:MAG: hypothetical protein QXJ81_00005, partial [Metallosphaera sp.]